MPIISGSREEGLIQPGSDIDIIDIIMNTDNIKPGFVRLVCSNKLEYYGEFIEAMIEKNDGLILSSLLFRDQMVDHMRETFTDTIAHGPCALYDIGFNIEVDNLFCLSCNTWPRVATEFLLKLYLEYAINSNTEVKDLLCSYFLKTTLFFCIEEENIIWNKTLNEVGFRKIFGRKSRILLDYLSNLYSEGVDSMRRIPLLSNLRQNSATIPMTIGERECRSDLQLIQTSMHSGLQFRFQGMERISVRVWTKVCKCIGTEEEVFLRRQILECQEKYYTHMFRKVKLFCIPKASGSRAEGLVPPGSDIDFMYLFYLTFVSDDSNFLHSDIIMDTNNIKPGFVRLICSDNLKHHEYITDAIVKINDSLFLSSLLFRDCQVNFARKRCPNAIAHGPCATYVSGLNVEVDNKWPRVATEWITRVRINNWPSPDLISDIVCDGCLVVPIGNPNSGESHMEWRLSFSLAEKKLVHSFNYTQFLCYGLLKLYLKYAINSNTEVNDLLCSYFLKTILFFCIEEENIIWNKENFLDCFWTCFRRLMKWVSDEYCPNYFIKENNMFEGKIYGRKSRILLDYLSNLYSEGVDSMRRIPLLSNLRHNSATIPMTIGERECRCDLQVLETSILLDPQFGFQGGIKLMLNICKEMQQSTNGIMKTTSTFMSYGVVCRIVPYLYFDIHTNRTNKTRYIQIQSLKQFINQNCMFGDVCTGKLLLATLFYLNGSYKPVLKIVKKVLRAFKPYIIYSGMIGKKCNPQSYIKEICGKGLTMSQKLKCGILAHSFVCFIPCKFHPQEIEHELVQHSTMETALVPPVIYCNVLLFLSYHHIACKEEMSNILSEFNIAMEDDRFIFENERPLTNALFNRCLQIWETWQLLLQEQCGD
ncbi:hypothetical protein KUTeg_017866 [Tegillarca granosa]|uniref:Uncharacterized protein n=1 Tax=Tegillarca granosa TaxID=220873 RepID=A0ABQ9EG66_TEGGR|nr:hypothetical protein KUTeg_017866 [Tegillarca granosa]